jgi:hypothetical protein
MKVKFTSNNLSIEFTRVNYFHVCLNRALAHCKHDSTLKMCRGPACRSFTTTPFIVELNTNFIFTAHIICFDYFALSVFLTIEFLQRDHFLSL